MVTVHGRRETEVLAGLYKMIQEGCRGITGCEPEELVEDLCPYLQEETNPLDFESLLIQLASEKTKIESPGWQFVAARLLIRRLYREVGQDRGLKENVYADFPNVLQRLTEKGLYGSYLLEAYSRKEIADLGKLIRPERDEEFTYAGLRMLVDRYLVRDYDQRILELPQERFLIIAMHLAIKEKNRFLWVEKFYNTLSKLEITVATPTLANAGRPAHQLSSCFIDTVDDSLWSIYQTDTAAAQVSKYGGGVGIYLGKVRARGSAIRGHKGASGGVIPWIRNFNNTAVAVDQLGVRQGAIAVYLDVWHGDILDFLHLKTNNGDERMKAHDIFLGVCIPDLFMRRVKERGDWYLFDPYEIRKVMGYSLEDVYGEDFEERYAACVAHPGLTKTKLPAIDIMKRIMLSAFETGTPFLFFRDTVNRLNPNKHRGMIYASNLCTEICQNMSSTIRVSESVEDGLIVTKHEPGDFVVCNLSSLNLGRIQSKDDLMRVIPIQMRMLDNVIDVNLYPLQQARVTNETYRGVGLGVAGYHQYLAQRGIDWESEEHLREAEQLFEEIAYHAIQASADLAEEKGAYPAFPGSEWENGVYFEQRGYTGERWERLRKKVAKGMRNGWLMAIAPTSSISLIAGTTAGIDPVFARFFTEEKRGAIIPQTAPGISPETIWYYKEAHQIDPLWSIQAAGIRQRHLDQSQSFNLYINPEIDATDFLNLYLAAWENGLKTLYYVRNQSLDVEEVCISCSS